MKVLFLASYPEEGQSTRYRITQYLSYLEWNGCQCSVRPFLSTKAYQTLYTGDSLVYKVLTFSASMLRLLSQTVRVGEYDVVFVQREAMLVGPPMVEWWISRVAKKPLIFDLDDAIFIPYESLTYGNIANWFRFPDKYEQIIRMSSQVIAGNEYLRDYAIKLNPNVTVIPTVVDTDLFMPLSDRKMSERPVLGWIGSHSTTRYLKMILPALGRLAKKYDLVLKVVGASEPVKIQGVECINQAWQLDREVEDFQSLDIGLYPLPDDPWARGKCGLKAIQYMAVGIPAVCSAVGVNKEIVQDGVNGYLAETEEEWITKLEFLLDDHELRRRLGVAGRATVEEKYSVQVQAPRVLDVIRSSVSLAA